MYQILIFTQVVYKISLFSLLISIGAKTIAVLPMAGMAQYLIRHDYKVKKV